MVVSSNIMNPNRKNDKRLSDNRSYLQNSSVRNTNTIIQSVQGKNSQPKTLKATKKNVQIRSSQSASLIHNKRRSRPVPKQSDPLSAATDCTNGPDKSTADNLSTEGRTTTPAARKLRTIDPSDVAAEHDGQPMEHVQDVDLHGCRIDFISNLDKFRKIKILDLSSNNIVVIENLHNNTEIRELKLYGNRISEIKNLDGLQELSSLQLQDNQIANIGKGLQKLVKLKILRLDFNRLSQLTASELASCSQLVSLDISYNCLDNITAVNCLPNLEELNVSHNKLTHLPDISRCKKIQELDVSFNPITEVLNVRSLASLKILNISSTSVTQSKITDKPVGIEELYASSCQISELRDVVKQFIDLQILDVSNNKISSTDLVSQLQSLPLLTELNISGNPCMDSIDQTEFTKEATEALPMLEVIDGRTVKKTVVPIISGSRPQSPRMMSAPAGRSLTPAVKALSATNVPDSRELARQIDEIQSTLAVFENELSDRFSLLRASIKDELSSNPTKAPPSSRCARRIKEAQQYAAEHFD